MRTLPFARVAASLSLFAVSALALTAAACGDDGGGKEDPTVCKPSLRAVVMVHGFLGSSDTWTSFARRFEANGYCADHIYALDWDSITRQGALEALDALIDEAIATTGDEQVNLIGHSAGGGLSYTYLADPAHAAKVATYVHLASSPAPLAEVGPAPAGPADAPITTLNLTSTGDEIIEAGEIPGAINLVLTNEDHYQVASSAKAFEDVFGFFNGGKRPTTVDLTLAHPYDPALPKEVEGKAVTLGDNVPLAGWTVDVYEVDPATGRRKDATAEGTFAVAADGSWGVFMALPEVHYEFHLHGPGDRDRDVHYYREPFVASDRFVRLRGLPLQGSLIAALFSVIPFVPESSVLVTLSESQAVVAGRDVLDVVGETLSTEALASAARTTVAFFLFDEKGDRASQGEVAQFKNITPVFLTALDRFFLAGEETSLALTFNGRTLNVPAWRGDPDGAVVVVFD